MYLLLCTALLGSALAVPLTEEIATRNDDVHYLLPGESLPTFYDVQLFFDPNNADNFTGTVEIRVLPVIQTNVFVLHAMEMDIDSIEVYFEGGTSNLFESYDHASDDTHFLRINLNTTAAPLTPHIIRISYTGRFAENMFGVYVSTYVENGETVNLITSQLQPTFARRAFPCYDQPGLKAVFRTTIYSPAAFSVIRSNTLERSELNNLKEDVPGWVKHEFEDTLVMSTYLIAYLVSNFDHVSNEDNNIFHLPFKVFSRPGTREQAQFALQYGQENMNALEEYTKFPYAFAKIDKAAVPDFAAGAMENWGLVIYREVALLVVDGVTTTATLQNIARIICHENVHMWFGNEVSPTTWTYTWLNEGFANFFENYATGLVKPAYRMMDQFVVALQNVMQSDAVVSVNPMTHHVYTPSQIIGTFNAVAYQKSGSVIRMMQHALTPEVFQSGLIQYLRVNSRRAATPNELYTSLQNALNESGATFPATINTILTRWTTQGGFPVLTVRRSAPTAQSVSIAQERFLTDPAQSTNDRWHVPLNWVLSTDPIFNDTSPQAWLGVGATAQAFQINGLQDAEWFIFNKQQTGYYRVNYEPANWQALAKVLNEDHELINLLNRAQIVDDSFNLARNGRLNYIHSLEISQYLLQEKDYIPWASANNVFNYLDIVLSGTPVYDLYQYYLLNLTAPLYSELGFQATDNDEFVTAYHRNIILDINCRYGNELCVDEAERLLQQFRDNPSLPLNPDIQTTVFCSGLRSGNVENFEYLWQQYEQSTDASQQTILLNSLGCTTNEDRLDFYLGQVIDDNSPVREQDKHTIIVSVINSSPENMDVALDFVVEHFDQIQPRVQGLTGTTNILNAFARRLNSEEHRNKIADFNSRHSNIFTPAETASIAAIEENISASITWSTTNLGAIDSWLQEHYGNSAGAVTSSIIVLISVVAVMLSS